MIRHNATHLYVFYAAGNSAFLRLPTLLASTEAGDAS